MTVDKETVQSAQKWLELLRDRAKTSHSVELASSSVNDLSAVLESLLKSHSALVDSCKDIDTIKARLAKLEAATKDKTAVMKPAVVKNPVRAVDEESTDAVA